MGRGFRWEKVAIVRKVGYSLVFEIIFAFCEAWKDWLELHSEILDVPCIMKLHSWYNDT